jgi:hypothetical protein
MTCTARAELSTIDANSAETCRRAYRRVGEESCFALDFGHFGELRSLEPTTELSLLGVERSYRGPEGSGELSPGFAWGYPGVWIYRLRPSQGVTPLRPRE